MLHRLIHIYIQPLHGDVVVGSEVNPGFRVACVPRGRCPSIPGVCKGPTGQCAQEEEIRSFGECADVVLVFATIATISTAETRRQSPSNGDALW